MEAQAKADRPGASPYHPRTYWEAAGLASHEFQADPQKDQVAGATLAHLRAELVLAETLNRFLTPPPPAHGVGSVFEVGCGRGRIAHLLDRLKPSATYSAIDLGPSQLFDCQQLRPDARLALADITDPAEVLFPTLANAFGVPGASPSNPIAFDLVLTCEVLMHVRPEDLDRAFVNTLSLVASAPIPGHLVMLEWVPRTSPSPRPGSTAPAIASWNFPHDYHALFRTHGAYLVSQTRTDEQMVFVVEPPQ